MLRHPDQELLIPPCRGTKTRVSGSFLRWWTRRPSCLGHLERPRVRPSCSQRLFWAPQLHKGSSEWQSGSPLAWWVQGLVCPSASNPVRPFFYPTHCLPSALMYFAVSNIRCASLLQIQASTKVSLAKVAELGTCLMNFTIRLKWCRPFN